MGVGERKQSRFGMVFPDAEDSAEPGQHYRPSLIRVFPDVEGWC